MTKYKGGMAEKMPRLATDVISPHFFFALLVELWYGSNMLKAFVGIASQRGIEVFCSEDTATVRFLWRRAEREHGRVACFWSVIPSDAVELIEATLNLGLAREALDLLQQLSRDYGLLVPQREEPTRQYAACHGG